MTNEEKAFDIAADRLVENGTLNFFCDDNRFHAALQMAQWKDEQFAKEGQALIEKMDSILDEAVKIRESAEGRKETGGWYWRKWAEWGYRKAIEVLEETKMKSLLQRAKEYASSRVSFIDAKGNRAGRARYNQFVQSYIHIAKAQQKIDIDNACEWLKENFNFILERFEGGAIERVLFTPEIEERFRKSMEESK